MATASIRQVRGPVQQRVSSALATSTFFEMEVEGASGTLVEFDRRDVGRVSFIGAHHSGGGFRAMRPDYLIDTSDCSDLILVLAVSGTLRIMQEGRHAELGSAGMALIDAHRSYSVELGESGRMLWIRFPRDLVEPKFLSVQDFLGRAITADHGIAYVAARTFLACAKASGEIDERQDRLLMNICVDMLIAMLRTEFHNANVDAARSRKKTMQRIEAFVDDNLCEPNLSLTAIAKGAGTSVRFVSKLFQEKGTSAGRWVLKRRIELSRQLLTDPREADRSIKEIAYGCGFPNISTFNRAFRRLHGETPSACRARNHGDRQQKRSA